MGNENKRAPGLRQQALFDDDSTPSASSLVTVAAEARTLSSAQRTFNRLTERIRRGREALADWEHFIPRFHGRVAAELAPIEDEVANVQRQVVGHLESLLAGGNGERLSRRHGAKARALLLQIVENLLENGEDAQLEALYDRYSDISYAERARQEVEIAEVLFADVLGPEAMSGHEAQSLEELMRHAVESLAEAESSRRDTSSRRSPHGRISRAAEKRAQAAHEASLSVRAIYRKLASALHPDRETDPAERDRKTALIQRANQAYDRNDLLELLSLQIETEQIDARALASLPEAQLRHYNEVLLDQARALDAQVQERSEFFRMQFGLTAREVTPKRVDQALNVRIAETRSMLKQLSNDASGLEDPKRRRAVLDALPESDDACDLDAMTLLAALVEDPFQAARRDARPRKKRKR